MMHHFPRRSTRQLQELCHTLFLPPKSINQSKKTLVLGSVYSINGKSLSSPYLGIETISAKALRSHSKKMFPGRKVSNILSSKVLVTSVRRMLVQRYLRKLLILSRLIHQKKKPEASFELFKH